MQSAHGCLLIHGLGGGTHEMEPLVKPLEEKGFIVAMPKLKGHTGDAKDLKDIDYKQWIFSAETGLLKLVQQCKKIYIVGLGIGGLIAIELSSRHSVAGLVCVNTPMFSRYLIGSVLTNKADVPWHGKMPWPTVKNVRLLLTKVKPLVSRITVPIKVAQSGDEKLATKDSASYLLSHVHAVVRQVSNYEKGGYSLFTGDDAENAIKDVLDFFGNLEKIVIAPAIIE
jgi:esterase/lipase